MRQGKDQSSPRQSGGSAFMVRVQYRQNSSWQGTIQWLDEKKTVHFRSLLEMTMLMNEALEKSGLTDESKEVRTWEEKEGVS
ncbi:MAG: hypothetical protein APF84_09895 [Gracilibacter sp. BRH_c7a]|nr:MAG: hypothetical protein APF84_09895 [Gracilibacter sp. BRH_c7a]